MSVKSSSASGQTRIELLLAIGVTIWIRYRAPQPVQEILGYILFTIATSVVSYYCLSALADRLKNRDAPSPDPVFFVHAKRSELFYLGVLGVGASFVLNGLFLLDLSRGLNQSSQLWWAFTFGAFALGLLYAWLGAYQFRISSSAIEYWSLFGGYRSLTLNEIQHARIRIGWFTYWDRYRPNVRLEILPLHGGQQGAVIVNLKVFREKDLDHILDWLGSKLDDRGKLTFGRRDKSV